MNLFSFLCIINGILNIILGGFVLLNSIKKLQNVYFFFFTLSIFTWNMGYSFMYSLQDPKAAFLFAYVGTIGIILIPFFANLFVQEILGRKEKVANLLILIYLVLLLSALISGGFYSGIARYYWGNYPIAGWLNPLNILFFILMFIKIVFQLWIEIKKTYGMERNKLIYLFFAFGLGSFGFIDWIPNYVPNIYPLAFILSSSWVFLIAYAILRHRLMDIEVIIRKGIIYSSLILSMAFIYSAIIFTGQVILQKYIGYNPYITSIFAAIIIAIGFKSLEEYITRVTDKIFFKKKYDYQRVLRDISGAMAHLTNLDRLVDLIVRILNRSMRLTGASAMILDEAYHRYVVKAGVKDAADFIGVSISDNYAMVEELSKKGEILVRDDIEQQLNSQNLEPSLKQHYENIVNEMKKLHTVVCVPTFSKGKHLGRKLIGILNLGEKLSQDMFTGEDIQLLATLANQASIALENAILYDEQIKSRDMLVRSEKMAALGTMAAGIVHELKNPLAFIQTVAQLLPLKWEDPEFRETTVKMLPSEATRMKTIIDGLLEYSRQHELKSEPVDLTQTFEKIITVMAYDFRKNNVEVKRSYAQPPKVMGDPNRLMQVFMNLFSNAVQAMPRGGSLEIKIEEKGERVAIVVSDTGFGIPQKQLREIFNPFFSTKETGTGLGLSISQKIVEEHKGQIDVESEVGKGTTFTVYLPKAA